MIRTGTRDGKLYTWSDSGLCIRQEQTGRVYENALDVLPGAYTYAETDIPVGAIEDAEALGIITGNTEQI